MKKTVAMIVLLGLILGALPLAADQTGATESEEKAGPEKDGEKALQPPTAWTRGVLEDQKDIWTAPLKTRGKQWWILGGTVLGTLLLIRNDEAIYRGFKTFQKKNAWVDGLSPLVTRLGLGEYNLGIGAAFYLGGALFSDRRARETAGLILATYIHTGLIAQVGKHLFSRQRPSWDEGQDHWHGPSGFFERYKSGQLSRYDAFPSGHTISVMGTATVISEMYRHRPWVGITAYTLAGLCGLSRVTEDTHWLSDVFLSTVLGVAVGKMMVRRHNRMGGVQIMPLLGGGRVGAQLMLPLGGRP